MHDFFDSLGAASNVSHIHEDKFVVFEKDAEEATLPPPISSYVYSPNYSATSRDACILYPNLADDFRNVDMPAPAMISSVGFNRGVSLAMVHPISGYMLLDSVNGNCLGLVSSYLQIVGVASILGLVEFVLSAKPSYTVIIQKAYGEMVDIIAKSQHEKEMAMLAREHARAKFQDWEEEQELHFDQSKVWPEI
ncbi:hypothetical protein SUGI_0552900 [Cryptomeria japonica]|nr:hypothetical protein SUGI_0552900 [Cryptomeria japonica]